MTSDMPHAILSSPVLMVSSGYEPLFRTDWQRALTAVYGGRAEVIEEHNSLTIGTVSGAIPYPTKVRFTTGIFIGKIKNYSRTVKLSRKSLFLRDRGECQYCGIALSISACTIDHVIPKSKGGTHDWENVVLACAKCNQQKGSRLLENSSLTLRQDLYSPIICDILINQ